MSITMKEIARLAGVSRPAVSTVLSISTCTRVSDKTRKKILRLAEKHNFIPNQAAQQLKGISTHLIALLSASSGVGFISVLQSELVKVLQKNGFNVLIIDFSPDRKNIGSVLKELISRRVEGVIGVNLPDLSEYPEKKALPIVYFSSSNPDCSDLTTDRFVGGYMAGKHLLEHGRKKPFYISLGDGVPNQEKFKGFKKAMETQGFRTSKESMLMIDYGSQTSEVVKQLKKAKADSIFCCNDYVGAKMMNALIKSGYSIPDDMALIGFDGYSFCEFTPVPMATIIQPLRQQADMAVELLLDRIGKNSRNSDFAKIKLEPELRPSASCGCPVTETDQLSGIDSILLSDET